MTKFVNSNRIDMTPIIDTSYTISKSMNRRYAKITYRKYRSKWQKTTFFIAIGLFVAGFACVFFKLPILFMLLILAGLYVFFMSWFGYLFQAFVSYRDMTRFYGDPINIHITFFKEFFRIEGDDNNFEFLYSQITDTIELEDISIIIVSAKGIISHGLVIDKKAFSTDELIKYYDLIYSNID